MLEKTKGEKRDVQLEFRKGKDLVLDWEIPLGKGVVTLLDRRLVSQWDMDLEEELDRDLGEVMENLLDIQLAQVLVYQSDKGLD